MSLLDDLTPTTRLPLNSSRDASSQWQVEQTARIERARALGEARAQALECASRVFTGRSGTSSTAAMLGLANQFLDWLLRPESES